MRIRSAAAAIAKADELATIINKSSTTFHPCAKGDSIYDYFHVAVIGYGPDTVVKSAFDGTADRQDLIPDQRARQQPLAHRGSGEEVGRRRRRPGGADGEVFRSGSKPSTRGGRR